MRFVLIFSLLMLLSPAQAQEATREAQVGLLRCTIEGGRGFLIGSKKQLDCSFERNDGKPDEFYIGEIKKFGIDIGRTEVTELSWAVFAPSKDIVDSGRLAGSYGGVSGEATFGIGLGANVLVGGLEKSFALQPLSLQVQKGLNVAAGIANLDLRVK